MLVSPAVMAMATTAYACSSAPAACRPPFQSTSASASSSSNSSKFTMACAHSLRPRQCAGHVSAPHAALHAASRRSPPGSFQRVHCSPRSMAPDEEKMTRRSPLDFPIEWERPRPGRRPDIFPQFSPMKTPLPQPPPTDPPEEDEEEEEKKEEEENPEEEPDKPPKET
ncbi:hypothetical protein KP509_24G011000 [Ceratopteris richardii]|uniref:Uncharacterized protein n=1 Tax=Ceratopteris richardii TaxID=49495 RepID=A0A8T2RTA2_CERRI|nr:hypothetical protein KP509_24G011000 [Ceratopteris richardii]